MSVITVGNFDGVHLGHRLLLEKVSSLAASCGEESIAVTFDRHPRAGTKLLCSNSDREKLIRSVGIDKVVFLDFSVFSKLDGKSFLEYLKNEFELSHFVCGSDFRFGKGAAYDVEFLRSVSTELSFEVFVIDFDPKTKISSSTVRTLLADGKTAEAESLLGYKYFVSGKVLGGKQLGRKLGYPTVNLYPDKEILLPRRGVYATDIILGGKKMRGVSNVGVRPTVEDCGEENIETFVLGEVLGQYSEATVIFKKFLRDEKKFASQEELSSQISKDADAAAEIV